MSERSRLVARLAPLALFAALAVAWLLPTPSALRLAAPEPARADAVAAVLDRLPDDPVVLIGFDPDLGTYAEIRPTARALIADLLARDSRLAFVSLTAEGRALAIAELARLGRGEANATRLIDLGFVPGAEAGLVDLTRVLRPIDAEGALARRLASEGMTAVHAIAVVGGNDLGPRSWVEQVVPRIGSLPVIAVTPTVLLPEVQPYLAGGQLDAALATPRDGAAYRATLDLGTLGRLVESREPQPLPVLIGLLVALAVLGAALARRFLDALGTTRSREAG